MKFTVGSDGMFVDSGVAKQNNLRWSGLLLPVKVIGNSDGSWDAARGRLMRSMEIRLRVSPCPDKVRRSMHNVMFSGVTHEILVRAKHDDRIERG